MNTARHQDLIPRLPIPLLPGHPVPVTPLRHGHRAQVRAAAQAAAGEAAEGDKLS